MATFSDIALHRAGIGLRQPHWQAMKVSRPATGFLEIHAENFLGARGQDVLDDLRRDYAFSLHAVGLSLASADHLNDAHLDRIATLIDRLQPALVSEHLCWSQLGGTYFNDLMPIPYTEQALAVVAAHIQKIQDRIRRPLLIENISAYLQFTDSRIPEGEFMTALAVQTGCGILCDVNNAFVNQINHGIDAHAWLRSLPAYAVHEIHLAGHTVNKVAGGEILIDDHGSSVIDPVWELYVEAIKRFPLAVTLIEWDTNIPALDILLGEAAKADQFRAGDKESAHAAVA